MQAYNLQNLPENYTRRALLYPSRLVSSNSDSKEDVLTDLRYNLHVTHKKILRVYGFLEALGLTSFTTLSRLQA